MSRVALVLATLAALAAAPSTARAHCYGHEAPRWGAHQMFVGLLNPNGLEHSIRVGLCIPLYENEHRAFEQNFLEVGAMSYLSPVYAIDGVYAQLQPATFFALRAEIAGVVMWPLGLNAVGYFPVADYSSRFRNTDLPGRNGGSATGWTARFTAITRLAFPIGDMRIILYDLAWLDYADIGDAPYYFMIRHNLITARSDWVFANEGFLLLGIPAYTGLEVRVGGYDALRDVPASGYVSNQLGGVGMLAWEHPYPGIEELDVFLRVGMWTNHLFRYDEAVVMAGVQVDHDLGPL